MKTIHFIIAGFLMVILYLTPLPAGAGEVPVDSTSVAPGTSVMVRDQVVELYGGEIRAGEDFVALMKTTDVAFPFKDKVTLVSIVPSLDTSVCEIQTYKLSTMDIGPDVDVITISRDLPMAQERFAREHQMSPQGFISDYKSGAFGKSTGLMMRERELLARAVIVLDKGGIIRYIQIVPEVSHLPDLKKAAGIARQLVREEL